MCIHSKILLGFFETITAFLHDSFSKRYNRPKSIFGPSPGKAVVSEVWNNGTVRVADIQRPIRPVVFPCDLLVPHAFKGHRFTASAQKGWAARPDLDPDGLLLGTINGLNAASRRSTQRAARDAVLACMFVAMDQRHFMPSPTLGHL